MSVRFSMLIAAVVIFTLSVFGADATNSSSVTALSDLAKPAKKIPFKEVIAATTGHRVLNFDTNNPAHVALHEIGRAHV